MFLGIQLIGVLFGIFMLYLTFIHFKRREYTIKEFSFWAILWVTIVYASIFPNTLEFIVNTLSIGRIMDFLVITGFMFLAALFFYMYTLIRANQKKLEDLVRKIAKDNPKGENKKL